MADLRKIRIATRASKLALTQSEMVAVSLRSAVPGAEVELVQITTSGDRKQDTPRASHSDKKDWVLELELAVLNGIADLAVHSGKDVPAQIEAGTALEAVLERASPWDVFIARPIDGKCARFEELPEGAAVGTASFRRAAQLLRLRPDLEVVEHRGNVPTRIEKLMTSERLSGIVLAEAGISRLGLGAHITHRFTAEQLVPAVNQGILAAQYRSDRAEIAEAVRRIGHAATLTAWQAERGCVEVLGADCNSAVCVYAEAGAGTVSLRCRILSRDGRECVDVRENDTAANAHGLGTRVAEKALAGGGERLIAEARLS